MKTTLVTVGESLLDAVYGLTEPLKTTRSAFICEGLTSPF